MAMDIPRPNNKAVRSPLPSGAGVPSGTPLTDSHAPALQMPKKTQP